MVIDLNQLGIQIHKANVAKGWWETPRSMKECINLAIGELYEALEADRCNRWCTSGQMQVYLDSPTPTDTFKRLIKDTVQDEIADTFIRVLDMCGHWGVDIDLEGLSPHYKYGNNFNEDIFDLNWQIAIFTTSQDLGSLMSSIINHIIKFCEAWNIDLMWHIEHKLKYNQTRPYKHGKNY